MGNLGQIPRISTSSSYVKSSNFSSIYVKLQRQSSEVNKYSLLFLSAAFIVGELCDNIVLNQISWNKILTISYISRWQRG